MALPDREFVTVLLCRDANASEQEQDATTSRLIDELGQGHEAEGSPVLPGWRIVGFGWGNEFDDSDEGDDE